jgi:hypothetical protein
MKARSARSQVPGSTLPVLNESAVSPGAAPSRRGDRPHTEEWLRAWTRVEHAHPRDDHDGACGDLA